MSDQPPHASQEITQDGTRDYVALLQLLAAYEFALDEGDPDGVANCFVEDGVWAGGVHRDVRGHDEIRAMIQHRTDVLMEIHPGEPIYKYRRHHATNAVLTVQGETASFKAYFLGTLRRGSAFETVLTGYYHGTLQRVEGGWKFKERHAVPDLHETGWWPPTEHA